MAEIWDWWFNWGAIIFLVVAILLAALVLFDTYARRVQAMVWQLGVILPLLLILPSVIYKTQLPAGYTYELQGLYPTDYNSTGQIFLWLGLIAGLYAIVITIGYFMTLSMRERPAQQGPIFINGINGGGGQNPRGGNRNGGVPPGPPPPVSSGRLYVRLNGGHEYRLNVGRNTIGRATNNTIVLDDPDISREHAYVTEQQGFFIIGDRGSTHGTYLNGQKVRTDSQLQDGDELVFGTSVSALFKKF